MLVAIAISHRKKQYCICTGKPPAGFVVCAIVKRELMASSPMLADFAADGLEYELLKKESTRLTATGTSSKENITRILNTNN